MFSLQSFLYKKANVKIFYSKENASEDLKIQDLHEIFLDPVNCGNKKRLSIIIKLTFHSVSDEIVVIRDVRFRFHS